MVRYMELKQGEEREVNEHYAVKNWYFCYYPLLHLKEGDSKGSLTCDWKC